MAANAGWRTLPSADVEFPCGLKGAPAGEVSPAVLVQLPLVVLLGTADIDPSQVHLRRTPEAMAQGRHRFARGQNFFATGKKRAEELKVPFGWQLITAPGVGHQDSGMSAYAVRWLFGQPPGASPPPVRSSSCPPREEEHRHQPCGKQRHHSHGKLMRRGPQGGGQKGRHQRVASRLHKALA